MRTKLTEEPANYSNEFETFGDMEGLGFSDDDIEAHLMNTAQSNVQDVVDIYSEKYRKSRGLQTLPESIWKPLRHFARLKCAEHCENVANKLRSQT